MFLGRKRTRNAGRCIASRLQSHRRSSPPSPSQTHRMMHPEAKNFWDTTGFNDSPRVVQLLTPGTLTHFQWPPHHRSRASSLCHPPKFAVLCPWGVTSSVHRAPWPLCTYFKYDYPFCLCFANVHKEWILSFLFMLFILNQGDDREREIGDRQRQGEREFPQLRGME